MRSMSVEFCDTNIVVYAYDATAGVKHERARELLERLWLEGVGAVSVQVLQELFVTLTLKIVRPVDPQTARSIVADLATWHVVQPTASDVLAAIDASIRWQLLFWDAMIVIAAQRAGAGVVWSEDLNAGQTFDGVTVRNPLNEV
jgi:predicted nucleic acid-binding protein